MKVSFELSSRDMKYFRERLQRARQGEHAHDEDTVLRLAEKMVEQASAAEPPEFVAIRLARLARLTAMLRDEGWRLEGRDRARILDVLTYFADPDDMIPDRTPGIGYIDDAIMIELVAEELKHEIKAYDDFCEYRKGLPKAAATPESEEIAGRRKSLQARMRRRRRRESEAHRTRSGSGRSPYRLW
jgi:uncharacterized membrane protein YkvA (DUF1232 family)